MRFFLFFTGCLSAALAAAPASAADCRAQSGPWTVALLELYTSEGCSSCPPADQWLSGIANSGYGADKVVSLAFHVDYWDYIGWKDRYAKPHFSARQRQGAGLLGFVYTPQVKLNGTDFRGWQQNMRFSQAIENSLQQPARANFSVKQSNTASSLDISLSAQIPQQENRKNADIYIAVYENGLSSKVNAGENNGQLLTHDYVVREFYGPYRFNEKTENWQRSLALKPEWKGRNAGIATFIQNRGSGEVLQALSLPLCG